MTDTYNRKPSNAPSGAALEEKQTKTENPAGPAPLEKAAPSPENSATDAPGEDLIKKALARRPVEFSAASGAVSFFQPADAFSAFAPIFLDEAHCRTWVILRLHPKEPHCPECGLRLENKAGFYQGKRVACGRCGHMFTATSSTFLQGSHLDYRQAFLLAVLIDFLQNGINAQRVSEVLGVSADTVRIWIKRFKALSE